MELPLLPLFKNKKRENLSKTEKKEKIKAFNESRQFALLQGQVESVQWGKCWFGVMRTQGAPRGVCVLVGLTVPSTKNCV